MDLRYCRVGPVKIHRTDRDRRPIKCDRIDLPPSPEEPMLTAGAAKTVPEPNDQASSVADPAMDDPLKFKLLRGPSGLSPTIKINRRRHRRRGPGKPSPIVNRSPI